jgi:propanediol dehydratase small subunit
VADAEGGQVCAQQPEEAGPLIGQDASREQRVTHQAQRLENNTGHDPGRVDIADNAERVSGACDLGQDQIFDGH